MKTLLICTVLTTINLNHVYLNYIQDFKYCYKGKVLDFSKQKAFARISAYNDDKNC